MSEAVWLPALVVLAAGLVLGLLLAFRLRTATSSPVVDDSADIELQIRDLEARRDDLLRRLRASEEDRLSAEERAALEEAAAMTLRDLDQLQKQRPGQRARSQAVLDGDATPRPGTAKTEAKTAAPSPSRAKPLLTGAAIAATMVVVVALLVYWAVRDAQPSQPMGGPPPQAQAGMGGEPPHQGQVQVSPELAAQIASLQQQVLANPEDLMVKKQLALSYVAAGQFFEAFEQASQVLAQFPDDPDGLLVHGIVRLTMGQADQAVGLLDRVLAEHPDHRQALIYRGLALYQLGRVEQALDTWDMGLQMGGGSDPELEQLIAMARSGQVAPGGMPAPSSNAPGPAPTAGTQPTQADAYGLQVDLAAGTQPAPDAVLFVFLRPEGGGAPVAATRVSSPTFPLNLLIDASHSMMGADLPEQGIMVARLDTDGNVTTSETTDLVAQGPASKGQTTRLTLGQ